MKNIYSIKQTMKNLQKYIDEKYISVQKHPTEDLYIYNYTQKAQFNRVWTEEILSCRGLIMNGKGEIIARPFKKFFNYEEYTGEDSKLSPLPLEDFEVFEKWDGSLGILYWIKDKPYLATRGSFISEQAIKGTEILRKKYPLSYLDKTKTYLFEIIYPENRIVIDYSGLEDIVLLAIFDIKTGEEMSYEVVKKCEFPVVKRFDGIKDITQIRTTLAKDNSEGFVIRFQNGIRIKIKFEEYVRLHRLITGINARHIWENLKEGEGIEELIDKVPDEFYKWVKETATRLNNEYEVIEQVICSHILDEVKDLPTRKEQALAIFAEEDDKKYSGIVFKMLDKKDYTEAIWKLIKPAHEVPFKKEI